MCSRSVEAGERPSEIPPASFAPLAAQSGKPVVAPVTSTAPCSTISRPSAAACSSTPSPQWPVSAAPATQILIRECPCLFSDLLLSANIVQTIYLKINKTTNRDWLIHRDGERPP